MTQAAILKKLAKMKTQAAKMIEDITALEAALKIPAPEATPKAAPVKSPVKRGPAKSTKAKTTAARKPKKPVSVNDSDATISEAATTAPKKRGRKPKAKA